jgi:hypothetical protein
MEEFVDQEAILLRLAGLGDELVWSTLGDTFELYKSTSERPTPTYESIVHDMARARETVCARYDGLSSAIRVAEQHSQRRRRMHLLRLVLGGTLIVVANTAAATVLFQPIAAASIALGSGAVGSITDLLNPA